MRKVLQNKVYDTEKARCIGSFTLTGADYGPNGTIFGLHRKRTGEYFLSVTGDHAKDFRLPTSTGLYRGPIIPLEYDKAQSIALEYLPSEDYAKEFGTTEDEIRSALYVEIPSEYKASLERKRSRTGHSLSRIVSDLVMAEMYQEEWRDLIDAGHIEEGLRSHVFETVARADSALADLRDALHRVDRDAFEQAEPEIERMRKYLADLACEYDDSWIGEMIKQNHQSTKD